MPCKSDSGKSRCHAGQTVGSLFPVKLKKLCSFRRPVLLRLLRDARKMTTHMQTTPSMNQLLLESGKIPPPAGGL